MEEIWLRLVLAWAAAAAATVFALAHLSKDAMARAVLGGTVGAIVGVILDQPGQTRG
jgi:hypothetical protein